MSQRINQTIPLLYDLTRAHPDVPSYYFDKVVGAFQQLTLCPPTPFNEQFYVDPQQYEDESEGDDWGSEDVQMEQSDEDEEYDVVDEDEEGGDEEEADEDDDDNESDEEEDVEESGEEEDVEESGEEEDADDSEKEEDDDEGDEDDDDDMTSD